MTLYVSLHIAFVGGITHQNSKRWAVFAINSGDVINIRLKDIAGHERSYSSCVSCFEYCAAFF